MQLFLHAVFAIVSYVIKQQYIHAQDIGDSSGLEFGALDPSRSIEVVAKRIVQFHEMRNHTFIALIDISFTDSSRKTCTGTIIYGNVVITARHCFGKSQEKKITPHISGSFVIIGSKQMFASGYEQYLPIERIIGHPKFAGWTADIALVFTYSDFVAEPKKSSTPIPIATEKLIMSKHSQLTVFSWGHCKGSEGLSKPEKFPHDNWERFTKYPLRAGILFDSEEIVPKISKKFKYSKALKTTRTTPKPKAQRYRLKKYEKERNNHYTRGILPDGFYRSKTSSKEYGDSNTDNDKHDKYERKDISEIKSSDEDSPETDADTKSSKLEYEDTKRFYSSIFRNSRRAHVDMVPSSNQLSVENFTFVNMQTCKEILMNSLPDKYKIRNYNEFICYKSLDHFVTDEDAGAPAVRQGQLVGITVGGIDNEDDHVAVGIKITCFCKWIAENLPEGANLQCCENCCDDDKAPEYDELDENDATQLLKRKVKRIRL